MLNLTSSLRQVSIQNDEFCIKHDELCIRNDDFYNKSVALAPAGLSKIPSDYVYPFTSTFVSTPAEWRGALEAGKVGGPFHTDDMADLIAKTDGFDAKSDEFDA